MIQGRGQDPPCRTGLLLAAFALVAACAQPEPKPDGLASVRAEVEALVWTFHAADTAMDAEAVIGMLWPDFEMLVDGERLSFEQVAQGSREFMSSLRSFHTVWSDLEVLPLSPDLAITSFIFRDSLLTAEDQLLQSRGPTTLLWERRGGEWRIRYGDADHYQISLPSGAG